MNLKIYNRQGVVDGVDKATAVTVGVFDGVHRGHRQLLQQLANLNPQYSTLIVTLTAHPSFVLGRRKSEYWLDDPEEHLRLLFDTGVDYIAVLPFTQEVAQMSACQMARQLFEQLGMRHLLLGYDSRFGSKQHDDFDQLPQLAQELGFTIQRGEPYLVDGSPISSSRIRTTLEDGRVNDTATLLGRPYSVSGTVEHGRGVGHVLGFPTANINLSDTRKMLPKEGVYAVTLTALRSPHSSYLGIANLGAAPTFGVEQRLLEVHLLDFEGDLYEQPVEVAFLQRLRDILTFDSPEALQTQLKHDLNACRELCKKN